MVVLVLVSLSLQVDDDVETIISKPAVTHRQKQPAAVLRGVGRQASHCDLVRDQIHIRK